MRKMKWSAAFLLAAGMLGAADMREGFQNPPDTARPQCWWHWVDRAVTAKGITADLEAMRAFGYDTAHIFTVHGRPGPSEWPEIMSPEWRKLFRHAAEEAARVGVKLGMNNCPGWTSSGGPWIKPEDSMKKLVFSETFATGGKPATLPQPRALHEFYRDVAVLAFPSSGAIPAPTAAIDLPGMDAGTLVDGDIATGLLFNPNDPKFKAVVTLTYPETATVRALAFRFGAPSIFADILIEVSGDGKTFSEAAHPVLRHIRDRGDERAFMLNAGRGVRGKVFRITLRPASMPSWLGDRRLKLCEIRATAHPLIPNVTARNGMGDFGGYTPEPAATAQAHGIDPAKMIDLTGKMRPDGTLADDALPVGNWTVLRIGMTTTGATNRPVSLEGLECDKLSRRGLDAHWPHMMGVLLNDTKDLKVIRSATIDSYEVGGQTWTDDLPREFARRRGYALKPYLPAVLGFVVGTRGESMKFLYDFQRTLSDLFAENYFDYFTELCHKNGLKSYIEPYWGPFDHIRCGRHADVPMGEFWTQEPPPVPMKLPSSIGNTTGRGRVGAESFTSGPPHGRWQQDPYQLKRIGDQAWLSGISLFVVHSYVQQPFLNVAPGRSLGHHGVQVNRLTPWWPMGRAWTDYVARGQFLLQQGTRTADLLVLAGESAPNDTAHLPRLYAAGWDFDYCSWCDVMDRMAVKDGRIALESGRSYPVFSLGPDKYLSLATLKKVESLVNAGATVAGLPPHSSPTLTDRGREAEYRAVITRLWGEKVQPDTVRQIGKGRLIASRDAAEIMRLAGVPPRWQCPAALGVTGRETAAAKVYFLRSRNGRPFTGKVRLAADPGQVPEIWDASTGETRPAAVWKRAGNMIELPVEFAPFESMFVVMLPGKTVAPVRGIVLDPARFTLTRAVYRAVGAKEGKDVTELVRKRLAASPSGFIVSNGTLGGDPAPMKRKVLAIKGTVDGRPVAAATPEKEQFAPSGLQDARPGRIELAGTGAVCRFVRPGTLSFVLADGGQKTVRCERLPEPVALDADWRVRFEKEPELPEPVRFAKLAPWNENGDPAIRYFSGAAEYEKTFTMPEELFAPDLRLVLDLGEVRSVAEVSVNGRSAGVWWHPPFAHDVTALLRPGENRLTVRVANLWPNRIIGDARTKWLDPVSKGDIPDWVRQDLPRSPSGRRIWSNYYGWKADDKLLPSGLIGPAAVRAERLVPAGR